MACTLSNKCAKNLSKRTVLLQLIIKNVVTCFFLEHCVVFIALLLFDYNGQLLEHAICLVVLFFYHFIVLLIVIVFFERNKWRWRWRHG